MFRTKCDDQSSRGHIVTMLHIGDVVFFSSSLFCREETVKSTLLCYYFINMIRPSCKGRASLAHSLLFVSTCWSSNRKLGNPWGKYPPAIPTATLQFVCWLFFLPGTNVFLFNRYIFYEFSIISLQWETRARIKFDIWCKSLSIISTYPMLFGFFRDENNRGSQHLLL